MKKRRSSAWNSALSDVSLLQAWRIAGRYFGYPYCCITAFCEALQHDERGSTITPTQREAGQGTGFIPCARCAALVVGSPDPKSRLAALISERVSPQPFPIDRNLQGLIAYVEANTGVQ